MEYRKWFDVIRLVVDVKQGNRECKIPIVDSDGRRIGRLEPLGLPHLEDANLIRQFVRWRNQNLSGYLDQRITNELETAKWLLDVVTNPTRITFLIYAGDKLIGRCGSVQMRPWEMMSDGLVRGESGGGMRFIYYAQVACIIWLFRILHLEKIHSTILSTNDMALDNCRSLGYEQQPYKSTPVYRKFSSIGDVLEEHGHPAELVPEMKLQYFRLNQESFFRLIEQTPGFAMLDAEILSTTSGS
jgi:hypothetical protein